MLRLEHLSCGYGVVRAVSNISFDVPAGGLLALLGPNGAGKTSTIMAIMGHTAVSEGKIVFEGTDITREPAVKRASLGIAMVPEGRRLFADLTAVLPSHSDRMLSLLRKTRIIHNPGHHWTVPLRKPNSINFRRKQTRA